MSKYTISRHIEGIVLNPKEYVFRGTYEEPKSNNIKEFSLREVFELLSNEYGIYVEEI